MMNSTYMLVATGLLAAGEKVVIWSEHTEYSSVYPTGIDGALQHHLADLGCKVRATGFDADDPGLDPADLAHIDVLVWFGHRRHENVQQALVEAISQAVVQDGMGFVALHSAHFSRPFQSIMGATGAWQRYIEAAGPQQVYATAPEHPLWAGLTDFTLPQAEMYVEPFDVPEPETVVAKSRWPSGEVNREVMTWRRGAGKVVYVATGHETYPIFHAPQMVRLVKNAIDWARKSPAP